MRPGGGCPAGLLLAVGWALLAGLQAARGLNVTALQDPGRARSLDEEEEGDGGGQGEGEGEAEEEAEENYAGESEHLSQREGEEEEEDGELGGSPVGTAAPGRPKPRCWSEDMEPDPWEPW